MCLLWSVQADMPSVQRVSGVKVKGCRSRSVGRVLLQREIPREGGVGKGERRPGGRGRWVERTR